MKNLTILFFILTCFSVNSQTIPLALRMDLVTRITLEEIDYLASGKVGTLAITVQNYDIYKVESSVQYYINYTNSRLTKSRKYLGYAWGVHQYEGNTIFFNKDTTKCWIWTVDKYGQIFKMDLPDHLLNDARVIKYSIQ